VNTKTGRRGRAVLAAAVVGGLSLLTACGSKPSAGAALTTTPPPRAAPPTTAAPATTPPTSTAPKTLPPTTVSPTTTPPTAAVTRQVLPPATVPPKVDECTQQLTFGADGNVGPISCADGDLNLLAWEQFAPGNPLVMSLGPYATPTEVQTALCADLRTSTIPIETSTYEISALYYGWSFGVDPSQILLNGGCPTPVTPAPVTPAPSPAVGPAQSDPWAVVSEYYGDVSSKDYPDAWALWSPSMQVAQGGYNSWVAGYANSGGQSVAEISESGNQVWYYLESVNPDGSIQWYRGSAIVGNGQIQSAHLTQLSGNPNA
jgi:hypothetical protein